MFYHFYQSGFCSLDLRRGPNYNTIGESGSSPGKCSAPVIFCVHGNRYGVVKCCEPIDSNLGENGADNAKLTGILPDVDDQSGSGSKRVQRAPSGMIFKKHDRCRVGREQDSDVKIYGTNH